MDSMYHMDGIIIIGDENHTNDLYSIYYRKADKPILRIEPKGKSPITSNLFRCVKAEEI